MWLTGPLNSKNYLRTLTERKNKTCGKQVYCICLGKMVCFGVRVVVCVRVWIMWCVSVCVCTVG